MAIVGALALFIIAGLALIIAPPPSGVTTEDDGSAATLPFIAMVGALALIIIEDGAHHCAIASHDERV